MKPAALAMHPPLGFADASCGGLAEPTTEANALGTTSLEV
jgi:hypothetical protein